MVKRGSVPSAASFTRSSVVLSCAVEKNFALEAEVSRLRHHVSVLSRRLFRAEKAAAAFTGSPKLAPVAPMVIPPSSPTPSVASVATVVTVLGGGLDPEKRGDTAVEELPREEVVPVATPPTPAGVGVGGPTPGSSRSASFRASVLALPNPFGRVVRPVAGSALVASTALAVQVPEPTVAEPKAGGGRASGGAADVAGDGGGGSSTATVSTSRSGKRGKNKKRRVKELIDSPVPTVPDSPESPSPPRARARRIQSVAPMVQLSGAGDGRDTFRCRSCGKTTLAPPFAMAGASCSCGGGWEHLGRPGGR